MPELRELLDQGLVERMQTIVADVDATTPASVLEVRGAIEAQRATEQNRTITEEKRMTFNVDNLTDAELGAIVRQRMKMTEAERLVSRREAALRDLARHEEADRSLLVQAQADRVDHALPGFTVGKIEVPALDLSQVSSLDESPSSAERSPYNKARFRLLKEGPLDPEETTYRTLETEHLRLATLASQQAKPEPKTTTVVLADIDRTTKAAALAEVKGISVDEALDLMTSLGI